MLVLLWAALLFSVSSSTGASARLTKRCHGDYCFTLEEGETSAEAGLCVVVPCSFSFAFGFVPRSIIWMKCESWRNRCSESDIIFHTKSNKVPPEFAGRVSFLEPDISQQNCSIIINNLTESDSGYYQVRVQGYYFERTERFASITRPTISVKGLSQKPTVEVPALTEGQQDSLTCSAPGLCSGSPPQITWTWAGRGEKGALIAGNITDVKTENLTAFTQRHSSTLTFDPSAKHHGTDISCRVSFSESAATEESVTLNVSYKREPQIVGSTSVKENDALNLTCRAESFPPSLVTWTKGSHGGLYLHNATGSATLVIQNVTVKDAGLYVCAATHLNETVVVHTQVEVTPFATILNSSGCVLQSKTLTCVCISEGFPAPTIKWPLLRGHTEFSVANTVSNHTVKSTLTLTVGNYGNRSVECVSKHENGEARENLTVQLKAEDVQTQNTLERISSPEVIVAFLIGVVLSASICCFAVKFRKNRKASKDLEENTRMSAEDDLLINKELPGSRAEKDATTADPELLCDPSDVQYASINFSLLSRSSGRNGVKHGGGTVTEYAEIKTGLKVLANSQTGDDRSMLEDEEKEEMVVEEKEEMEDCTLEKQEEGVYSNVKDIMNEI